MIGLFRDTEFKNVKVGEKVMLHTGEQARKLNANTAAKVSNGEHVRVEPTGKVFPLTSK